MIPVQIRVTKRLIELVDELIRQGVYSNRSQAIRDSLRKNVDYYYRADVLRRDDYPEPGGLK